jgi:hypothetical protein
MFQPGNLISINMMKIIFENQKNFAWYKTNGF